MTDAIREFLWPGLPMAMPSAAWFVRCSPVDFRRYDEWLQPHQRFIDTTLTKEYVQNRMFCGVPMFPDEAVAVGTFQFLDEKRDVVAEWREA